MSWLGLVLLLAIWLTRVVGVDTFPPFVDEAFHINFGRNVAATGPLMHAEEGRQLVIWWFMVFQAGTEAPFFTARVAGLLVVMIGVAAFMGLGRLLAGRWGFLLAGLVLLFSPYHMFFDRLALADPASNALTMTGIFLCARLLRRTHLGDALLAGLALFLGFGAKVSALPYLAAPLAAVFALRWRKQALLPLWTALALSIGSGLAAVWIAVLTWRGHNPFFYLLRGTTDSGDGITRILNRVPGHIETNLVNLAGFFGSALLVLLFGALAVLIWQRRWFLPPLVIVPWGIYWLNNRPDTRHLMTPVSLLMLCGVVVLAGWLPRRSRLIQGVALGGVVVVGLIVWLPYLLNTPRNYPLPPADYRQYIASESSGTGFDVVIDYFAGRQPQRIYGLAANCLSLELMTLGQLPVMCPRINPNGETVPELAALLREAHPGGTYAVVEAIDYIPQETKGPLLLTIERPQGGPVLQVYDLAP